ncbi:hypothetical protein Tco_1557080 [Tanacetum coccineum]
MTSRNSSRQTNLLQLFLQFLVLDEAQAKNEDFINKLDDNIKKIIKEQVKAQVKEQVTKILPQIEKTVNAQLEAECTKGEDFKSSGKSKEGSKSHNTSTGKSAQAEEPIHADEDLEEPIHQKFNTGFTEDQPVDETTQHHDWF